jgi:hypothetical protein
MFVLPLEHHKTPGILKVSILGSICCLWLLMFSTSSTHLPRGQGDQIGRIFASWVTVFFRQFFKHYWSSQKMIYFFPHTKLLIHLDKKSFELHFGRFFSWTRLVTLLEVFSGDRPGPAPGLSASAVADDDQLVAAHPGPGVGAIFLPLFVRTLRSTAGLPDFSWSKHTITAKIYQITTNYTKRPYIIPNGSKIFQMVIIYDNIFHSKALRILPKLGFLVWK